MCNVKSFDENVGRQRQSLYSRKQIQICFVSIALLREAASYICGGTFAERERTRGDGPATNRKNVKKTIRKQI